MQDRTASIATVPWYDAPTVGLGFARDRSRACRRLADRYGSLVRLPVPGKNIVLVTQPSAIRHVLLDNYKNYKKSWDYEILSDLLGRGLITSNGEPWLAARRTIQPLFAAAKTDEFLPTMMAHIGKWLATFDSPNTPIDVTAASTELTLSIVGERLFSSDVTKTAQTSARAIAADLDVCQRQVMARAMALFDLAHYVPTLGQWRFQRALKRLDLAMERLIEERSSRHNEQLDMMTLLLRARDPDTGHALSKRQVRDEILTMFFAGFETTAVALGWALDLLARHADQANWVYEEVRAVVPRDLTPAGTMDLADALKKLVRTRAVVDETLRLYPPIPIFGRQAVQADMLDGVPIAAGTQLAFCAYATQHDARLWPEPDRFWPERFLQRDATGLNRFSYFPFGAGPRACIGAQFALTELTLTLASVLARFEIRPGTAESPPPRPFVSYRPGRPIRLYATRR